MKLAVTARKASAKSAVWLPPEPWRAHSTPTTKFAASVCRWTTRRQRRHCCRKPDCPRGIPTHPAHLMCVVKKQSPEFLFPLPPFRPSLRIGHFDSRLFRQNKPLFPCESLDLHLQ